MTALQLPPAPTAAQPSHHNRLPALDILRGIAILGTLATNIGIFAANPDNYDAYSTAQEWLSQAIGLVTDGKWIGLLTIMFGIGLEIQRQSAVRRGDTWLGTYPWRAALLIIDGLLNYIFIFQFDVLMGYGITGLVVCLVMATSPRVQAWVLALGITVHVAFLTYLSVPMWRVEDAFAGVEGLLDKDPSTLTPVQLAVVAKAFELTPKEYLAEWKRMNTEVDTFAMSDSYWAQVHERVIHFWSGRGEIPIMFTMGLGLFLVGARLYRAGLFLPAGAALRKKVMLLSFGIGLPIDFVTRIWFSEYTGTYNRYLTSTMVSFGVLALVAQVYARGRTPRLPGRLVSYVGRMALTCYLSMNLIASILFYDWGFGLARRWEFGIFNDVLGWLLISTILIAMSTFWMRRHDRGPVEWVWHQMYEWLVRNVTRRWQERALGRRAGSDPSLAELS